MSFFNVAFCAERRHGRFCLGKTQELLSTHTAHTGAHTHTTLKHGSNNVEATLVVEMLKLAVRIVTVTSSIKTMARSKKKQLKKLTPLGKANSLLGDCWKEWLSYVRENAGLHVYLVLYITQALCLRITQAAQLQSKDFDFRRNRVWIAPFKKHVGAFKPLPSSVKKHLMKIKHNGLKLKGKSPFSWPSTGFLFPATKGNKPHIGKDVIARHIRSLRGLFVQKFSHKWPQLLDGRQIRSHSGRRHAVSTLCNEGLSDNVIMAWSQIDSYRTFKGYVDRNPSVISKQIHAFDAKFPIG
jgi:integrase